jgi:signal transduction histidine kinase
MELCRILRILLMNQVLQIFWQVSSRKEYLQKVVETLQEWTGCECLGIRILNEEKGIIPYEAQVGFGKDFLKSEDELSLHSDECACVRVVAGSSGLQDRPAMTEGGSFALANSLSFITDLQPEEQKRFRGVCIRCGYLTIAVIPLRYRQEVLGAIHIADRNAAALSVQEVQTLEAAAAIIGQGIYRFEISDNLKRAEDQLRALSRRLVEVQENERRIIARELHDEVGQSLTALKMLVAQAMRGQQSGTQAALSEAFSVVSDLMKQVRDMSLDLRPSMLDDLGLLPALLWQFQRFSGQTGIKLNFQHSGLEQILPPEINTAVFRVVQEAMTNIVRHAGVSEANVDVTVRDGTLSILVQDKGRGFN